MEVKVTSRPRPEAVIRRFISGESIYDIALSTFGRANQIGSEFLIESIIRRRMNRLAKKGKKR